MSLDTSGARTPDWTLDQALRPVSHILRHGIERPWRAPPEAERAELLRQISPVDRRLVASAQSHVAFCMLPWYENAALLRVVDAAWGDASIYFLHRNNTLFRLDGGSTPIHDVNAIAPLQLAPENVLEYLKFFCFFVRGEEGPFYLLERADHPILTFDRDDETEDMLHTLARAPTCDSRNAEGAFVCSGVVLYGAAIFEATFAVQQGGIVEMLDDDPVEVNLAVRFNATLGV